MVPCNHTRSEVGTVLARSVVGDELGHPRELLPCSVEGPPTFACPSEPLLRHVVVEWKALGVMLVPLKNALEGVDYGRGTEHVC